MNRSQAGITTTLIATLLFGCAPALAALVLAAAASAAESFSPAERLLFLSDHLANVGKATVMNYAYSKVGTLDPAGEGSVNLTVTAMPQGSGKHTHVDFLSGARKFELPDIDDATSNPVILFFLERDVRDMQRRTGGQASYFRKRVRMALAEAAQVETVQFELSGRTVNGTQISIHPFTDDPLRSRFQQLAEKMYVFTLSQEVPGQLYRMQTRARAPQAQDDAPPLLEESITFIGAEP
jgi:hypothetical protein